MHDFQDLMRFRIMDVLLVSAPYDAFLAQVGYFVLEQSQAGVDMLGHRLVPIKHMDLK